jgi:hypothetical protein
MRVFQTVNLTHPLQNRQEVSLSIIHCNNMNPSTTGQLSLGRQLFTSLMIMIQALKGGILFVLLSLTLCITVL